MVVCNPLLQADCEGPDPHLLRRLLRHTDVGYPGLIGGLGLKVLLQKILGDRKRVVGVRCCLEFPYLLAAKTMFLADALDPVNSDLYAVLGEVGL